MFIGEYFHNLDAKGRIIIPSKFREELHASFMLNIGLDGCLTIYSLEQWNKVVEEISKLPTAKADARKYVRTLFSMSCDCTLDSQGRILIPSNLASKVGISKECVIVGVNDHIEIWDKEAWNKYFEQASASFEEVAENLSDLFND